MRGSPQDDVLASLLRFSNLLPTQSLWCQQQWRQTAGGMRECDSPSRGPWATLACSAQRKWWASDVGLLAGAAAELATSCQPPALGLPAAGALLANRKLQPFIVTGSAVAGTSHRDGPAWSRAPLHCAGWRCCPEGFFLTAQSIFTLVVSKKISIKSIHFVTFVSSSLQRPLTEDLVKKGENMRAWNS